MSTPQYATTWLLHQQLCPKLTPKNPFPCFQKDPQPQTLLLHFPAASPSLPTAHI